MTFGSPVTIEASSALDAAERILGSGLSIMGQQRDLAGRVLRLNEDYRTTAILVFRTGPTAR
jgi:hypothetical protein